jgi:hypothetical protein
MLLWQSVNPQASASPIARHAQRVQRSVPQQNRPAANIAAVVQRPMALVCVRAWGLAGAARPYPHHRVTIFAWESKPIFSVLWWSFSHYICFFFFGKYVRLEHAVFLLRYIYSLAAVCYFRVVRSAVEALFYNTGSPQKFMIRASSKSANATAH